MSKYAEIIERLEKATGPDRLIDVLTAYATDYVVEDISLRERMDRHGVEYMLEKVENSYNSVWQLLPRYTASMDAAIALVEKAFPGKVWYVRGHANGDFFCQLFTHEVQRGLDPKGTAPTAPLAILLSFFRALEAKENAG